VIENAQNTLESWLSMLHKNKQKFTANKLNVNKYMEYEKWSSSL